MAFIDKSLFVGLYNEYSTPTRATPFSLTYGTEEMLPLEVEIPSLRVSLKGLVIDEDYRAMRLQELELLDEKHQTSFDHMTVYQMPI